MQMSVCKGKAVVGVGKGRISSRNEVVNVKPKPRVGLTSSIVDAAETLLLRLTHVHRCSSPYLAGNFGGVPCETPPVPHLPLSGHLPGCLNGAFVRVGPNPRFKPLAGYHWFDGGGMIHGLRIKDGTATYVSRYVNTSRLQQEQLFGAPKFLKGLSGLLMLFLCLLRKHMKVLDFSYGAGTANTALTFHNGKLLALHEADKPYVIRIMEDGDLQTVGMLDYDSRLIHPFTAHPKIDPITGEMFVFGCSLTPPYLTYGVISRDGSLHQPVPITTKEATLMHDFAITQNYAIFMDLPMHFRPKEILKGHNTFYSFDATRIARFGVLPRYAADEADIRWFELPSCFIFHNANAWEEGEEVVMIACRFEDFEWDLLGEKANPIENHRNELYEMRFNLVTGKASQKRLSLFNVEFPKVNDLYIGRKQRYVYAAMMGTTTKVTGIVKFDLNADCESGVIQFEPGTYGSEPVFVPRVRGYSSQEDDGFLIFFAHDELTGKSTAKVMDAKTMSAEPVAVVELPSRVPYGLHAAFVTQEQLQQQQAQL